MLDWDFTDRLKVGEQYAKLYKDSSQHLTSSK